MRRRITLLVAVAIVMVGVMAVPAFAIGPDSTYSNSTYSNYQVPAGQCQVTINGTTSTPDAATCAKLVNSALDTVKGFLGGLFPTA
jgi:hypothetical protein